MTEAVKNLSENVAKGMGVEGSTYMSKSYIEILYPYNDEDYEASSETAEQIIENIRNKLTEYE